MDYIVDDRGEKINKIEKIMGNIHSLAKDIAVKVDEQEEGLVNIDQQVQKTVDNTKAGNKELQTALEHQRRTGKCNNMLVGIIIIAVIITMWILFTQFGSSSSDSSN